MDTEKNLKGYQRSYLKRHAHALEPVVWIGKDKASEGLIAQVDRALEDHEIIKVKFVNFKEEKKAIALSVAESVDAYLVAIIGNIAILYRHQPDPEKRVIHLPK